MIKGHVKLYVKIEETIETAIKTIDDRKILIRMEPKKNAIPSLFSFGEKIAKSYFPVDIGLSILAIAI